MSAKYSLPVFNKLAGHSTFAQNVEWFYQLEADVLANHPTAIAKRTRAIEIFLADAARESKIVRPRPNADTNFSWQPVTDAQTPNSNIFSLTPSTVRPDELISIQYRGDGRDNRFAFNNTGGVAAITWVFATRDGYIVANSGPAETASYQPGDASFTLTAEAQSTAEIKSTNAARPAPIQPGVEYLLAVKISTPGGVKNYVHLFVQPANPNAQVTTLTLAPTATNTSDPFTNYDMSVRYMGLFPYNNNRDSVTGGVPSYDAGMVTWSKKPRSEGGAHMNCFISNLQWQKCQNPDGSYDYRMLDTTLALAASAQLPVKFCFDMAVSLNNSPDSYLLASECMRDQAGNPMEKNDARAASYSSVSARAKHATFLNAMLARAKASPHASWLMGVFVCNGAQLEHEYPQTNRVNNNNDIPVLFDYSDNEKIAFRTRVQGWYPNIAAANQAWGTNFSSFSTIEPPVPPRGNDSSSDWNWNASRFIREWYNHRQIALADYANFWHDLVKAVSPRLKTLFKCGNLIDGQSVGRGTVAVAHLLRHDCISQDNDPSYNFPLSHAVGKRSRASNFYVADEVFFVQNEFYSQGTQVNWIKDAFAAGCSFVDWGAFYKAGGGEFDEAKIAAARQWISDVMEQVHAAYPIGGTVANPAATATLNVSTLQLLALTWFNGGGGQSYAQQYATLAQGGTTVKVTIDNDIILAPQ